MKTLIFAAAILLVVPVLRAQHAEAKEDQPLTVPQAATNNSSVQDRLPAAIRPGHSLDPADVDILTGKRDREIEASEIASAPVLVGNYGSYGNFYGIGGRGGSFLDFPFLPLTRIRNPFLFSTLPPRGFGRGRFRGRR